MKASTSPFREPTFRLIWQIQKQYVISRAYDMPRRMKIGAIVMRHQCFLRYREATWLTIVGIRTPTTNCGSKHSCAMLSQIGYLSANQQHNRVSACLCRVQVCWKSDISCLIFMRDSLTCVSTAVHINLSSKIKQELCAIPFCLLASSAHFLFKPHMSFRKLNRKIFGPLHGVNYLSGQTSALHIIWAKLSNVNSP